MTLNPFRQTSAPERHDADLRSYAASGDAESFRRLVERHLPTVQEAAARILGSGSPWLDDVAQDVFLRLARKAPQLPADTVVCAWLHRQAVRRAIDLVRSEDRRRKREAAVDLAPVAEDPSSVWNTIAPRLDQELLRLPRQDQEVLALRFMERCSSEEAARRLGLSSVAVRKRVERALAKLRERLALAPLPGAGALTVTALAAYLSVPTAKAAPAAKVAAISAHCLAAPAATTFSLTTFTLMTKSQIYTTSAILAIGAGAFFAGRTNGLASAQAIAAESGSAASLATLDNGKAPRSNSSRRTGTTDAFPTTKEGRLTMLRMILGNGDALQRNQSLERFMARLDPGEFKDVVDFLGHQRPKTDIESQAITSAMQIMVSTWAKRDPVGAIEALNIEPGSRSSAYSARNSLLQTIASVWGARDPDAAIAWVKAQPGYPLKADMEDPFMVGLIGGVAGQDLSKATGLLAEMPFGMVRRTALSGMLPQLLAKGEDAVVEWIDGLQDSNLKKGANNMVAAEMAQTNPRAAAEWILRRMGSDAEFSSIDSVMAPWMQKNSSEALAYFETLPAGKVREEALNAIVGLMQVNPTPENADWIIARAGKGEMQGASIEWVFSHWTEKDPAAAIACFESMSGQSARDASFLIADQLAKNDPAAAVNFYKSHVGQFGQMAAIAVFRRLEAGDAVALMDDVARNGREERSHEIALEAWAATKPEDAKAYCEQHGLSVPENAKRIYMKAAAAAAE